MDQGLIQHPAVDTPESDTIAPPPTNKSGALNCPLYREQVNSTAAGNIRTDQPTRF